MKGMDSKPVTIICCICGVGVVRTNHRQKCCKSCSPIQHNLKTKLWHKNNVERETNTVLRRRYNLTSEQLAKKILDQNNMCAICLSPLNKFRIDHDHVTGKTRDLLCNFCNIALSFVENSIKLERALQYINKHKEDNV